MSNITRRPTQTPKTTPKANEAALAAFIGGAPDGAPAPTAEAPAVPRKMIGKQTAISLALPPDLLEKIDQMANSLSITRAGFIKQALTKAVQAESN
jgi:hypothetical protein